MLAESERASDEEAEVSQNLSPLHPKMNSAMTEFEANDKAKSESDMKRDDDSFERDSAAVLTTKSKKPHNPTEALQTDVMKL